jgi:hypothetical protein
MKTLLPWRLGWYNLFLWSSGSLHLINSPFSLLITWMCAMCLKNIQWLRLGLKINIILIIKNQTKHCRCFFLLLRTSHHITTATTIYSPPSILLLPLSHAAATAVLPPAIPYISSVTSYPRTCFAVLPPLTIYKSNTPEIDQEHKCDENKD